MNFECLVPDSTLNPCLARFFPWNDLSDLCSTLLSDGLQHPTAVSAVEEDRGRAWRLKLVGAPMSKDELNALMDTLDATDYDQEANDFGEKPVWELSYSLGHKLVARVLPFHVVASHATGNGVWFTGCAESETLSSVYAVITSAGKDRKEKDDGRGRKRQKDDAVICA